MQTTQLTRSEAERKLWNARWYLTGQIHYAESYPSLFVLFDTIKTLDGARKRLGRP